MSEMSRIERRPVPIDFDGTTDAVASPRSELVREEIARAVDRAWTAVLGSAPSGAGEGWTASGGDSLKALRLLLSLGEALGRRVSMDVLDPDSTKASLTEAIFQEFRGDGARPGGREVVFLLPGIGGDEPRLADFRRTLTGDIRFELLDYPDIERPSIEIGDLEAIMSSLTDQLLAKAPFGPVRLTGYSYGGLMAFDLARRLTASGREVEFLGVLDTSLTSADFHAHGMTAQLRGAAKVSMPWMLQNLVLVALIRAGQFELVRRLVLFARRTWGAHRAMSHRNLVVFTLRRRALRALDRTRHAGRVVLFRAEPDKDAARPDDLGWRALSTHVEMVNMQGDHTSMLLPPHLERNAAVFLQAFRASLRPSEIGPVVEPRPAARPGG